MKNRYSKRAGYGPLRGATNPRISVTDTAPTNPHKYDIWMDISGASIIMKYYDGSAWQT